MGGLRPGEVRSILGAALGPAGPPALLGGPSLTAAGVTAAPHSGHGRGSHGAPAGAGHAKAPRPAKRARTAGAGAGGGATGAGAGPGVPGTSTGAPSGVGAGTAGVGVQGSGEGGAAGGVKPKTQVRVLRCSIGGTESAVQSDRLYDRVEC